MTHRLPTIGGGHFKNGSTVVECGSTGEDMGGCNVLAAALSAVREKERESVNPMN